MTTPVKELSKNHPNTDDGEIAALEQAGRQYRALFKGKSKADIPGGIQVQAPTIEDIIWDAGKERWQVHYRAETGAVQTDGIDVQQQQITDANSGETFTVFYHYVDGKARLAGFRASDPQAAARLGLTPDQLLEVDATEQVGNQMVYSLRNGMVIKQNIEKPDKVISGADIRELRTTMLNDGSSLQWFGIGDQVKNFHIPADVDLTKVKFSHAERLGAPGEVGYNELVAVMTDGSKFRFSADTEVMNPTTIAIANEIELDDRTVVILNDGTKVQIPHDEDLPPAEILQDEQTGEWYVKQPKGNLTFFEPYREGKLTQLANGEIAVIQPDGKLAPWPTKVKSGTFRDPNTGRWFEQQTTGAIREMDPLVQPSLIQMGDREFLQQSDTSLEELDPRFDPGVITRDGMRLIQQPGGEVSQPRPANLDEVIAQALIDGDFDKAFAFQDFKTRPTALEAFQAAVAFARSPADQQLISSLARGETTVEPPPPGTIRRVGPQPDFLVQEYNTFQQRLRAGRPPSAAEQQQFMTRFQEGRTPLTDQHEATISQQQQQLQQAQQQAQQQKADFDLRMAKLETANQKQAQSFQKQIETFRRTGTQGSSTTDDTETYQETVDGVTRTYRGTKGTPGANPTAALYVDPDYGVIDDVQAFAEFLGAFDMLVTTNPDGSTSGASALSVDHIANIARQASQSGQNVGTAIRNAINNKRNDVIANAPAGSTVSQGSFSSKVAAAPAAPAPVFTSEQLAKKKELETARDVERARLEASLETDDGPPASTAVDVAPTATAVSSAPTSAQTQQTFDEIMGGGISAGSPSVGMAEIGMEYSTPTTSEDIEQVLESGGWGGAPGGWAEVSGPGYDPTEMFAKGGMTSGKRLEIVGEEGPELVDLPPGTFVLPIKGLNQRQVRQAKRRGVPGYQSGGVVFEGLPFGLRQLQAGRAITPPRGYLSRAAGLTLPSAQAFQNITPESRDVFMDLASQAGIPPKSFAQELQLTQPRGARQPTVRMLPFSSRGAR